MPQDDRSIQARHPRVHTFLYQLALAIITFYSAIAISHYGPTTPASAAAPRATTPSSPPNPPTPYVCKTDDVDAILTAITPPMLLCPSTTLFLLSLLTFILGILKFNALHTQDIDLVDGYAYFVFVGVISLDWDDVWVSIRATMPMVIWSATVVIPVAHWVLRTVVPGPYGRYREAVRVRREAVGKALRWGGVESGGETVGGGWMRRRR
ncbi:hypothetical protein BU24DRAFT_491721 [Aaosphaeria arxii CBS 175.79]|uniref:Uncharacterized protein n=1 Tax=Aaosphaeria arxii CBS 175.79 TaxID=1450172 RepID=A0A6A5XRV6_9PLEO|nr:uncharacterized protein BU24DRAFT_491721 [Aaosphaeria arxii CBS 175.79]KAF2015481.1 hypothetical protein BU24DRAFT_491721 [Aaosphaeria arxii CBS 175.79]